MKYIQSLNQSIESVRYNLNNKLTEGIQSINNKLAEERQTLDSRTHKRALNIVIDSEIKDQLQVICQNIVNVTTELEIKINFKIKDQLQVFNQDIDKIKLKLKIIFIQILKALAEL